MWEGRVVLEDSELFPKNSLSPLHMELVSPEEWQPLSFSLQGFSRQSSLLFKILSSVRNHQINSDLAQLLLRLDYNKYYTQAGGTLGR